MYLRKVHTRAGIIWYLHDAKELHELVVPTFKRLSSIIAMYLATKGRVPKKRYELCIVQNVDCVLYKNLVFIVLFVEMV